MLKSDLIRKVVAYKICIIVLLAYKIDWTRLEISFGKHYKEMEDSESQLG
jgi:hypothetical protein